MHFRKSPPLSWKIADFRAFWLCGGQKDIHIFFLVGCFTSQWLPEWASQATVIPYYVRITYFVYPAKAIHSCVCVYWLLNVTTNDIFQLIYIVHATTHRCAGGLKKKFDLRSGWLSRLASKSTITYWSREDMGTSLKQRWDQQGRYS